MNVTSEMNNIRVILGGALILTAILLAPFYFGENESMSAVHEKIESAKNASNSTYAIEYSTISTTIPTSPKQFSASNTSTNFISNPNGSHFERTPGCELLQLDPWDPSIRYLINKNYHPLRGCKPTVEYFTVLENGTLTVKTKNESMQCWYRCNFPDTDYKMTMDEWRFLNISAVPNCDIVETQCNISGKVTYRRMHPQVVPEQNLKIDKNVAEPFRPNVFIFLFDAVSRSSGIRSMSETIQVLTEKYSAFDFRGLNVAGMNSLPNGYAFLTGIRIEELPSADIDEKFPSEKPNFCPEYLDNSTFVVRNFTSSGYVSLMGEDWALGVFNWPNCSGFAKKPVTHYMRPFYLRIDGDYKDEMMEKQVNGQICRESYQQIMEYYIHFLKAYPAAVPKFSLVWISNLAHDHLDGLFHVDKYFADFFRENRQLLRESFIFLMGDHGKHYGQVMDTKIGQLEHRNPLLFVGVPESLTSNKQLMDNMRTNSAERLISHYDIFTSLLDIAAVAPRTNWTDFGVYNWSKNEGLHQRQSSILRPLDPERTCNFMQISPTYCFCKSHEISIPKNNQTVINAAIFLSQELKRKIAEKQKQDICADLNFKEVVKASIEKFNNSKGIYYMYRITFNVSPSNGTFQADVQQTENGFQLLSPRISRINAYGNSSHCLSDPVLRPICYCRDKL